MTRDELIERLNDALRKVHKSDERIYAAMTEGLGSVVSSIEDAISRVEQLDSPPAMTWQDEPDEDWWYWVMPKSGSKIRACRVIYVPGNGWFCDGAGGLRPLDGRQVCRIPAPPALPKRGDA